MYYLVYITCKNIKEAKKIGKKLVEEKIAACVNIIPKVFSYFYWKNKFESVTESILLAKCSKKNLEKLIKRVKELHSYELPDISAIEIKKGLKEFIEWVNSI